MGSCFCWRQSDPNKDGTVKKRIYLSPPDVGEEERALVADAFATNWIAPLGPHVDAFEAEFADAVGASHAVALTSGTAALHLALIEAGVGPGDVVLVSTLTFSASVNPILYLGATPHFIDSEAESWNMDPELLKAALEEYATRGRLPKAVVAVHLYGQAAEIDLIAETCAYYGVTLVEDAAEALGATFRGRSPGTFGEFGIFSFNGNKIITTSGGGMLVTQDAGVAAHVRKLATQAREPAVHYEHREVGYNYRMSNVLAAIGRGQLRGLAGKVARRRRNFDRYVAALGELPGIGFMPEATWGLHSRWLTVITVDEAELGASPEALRLALDAEDIEARPVWKPMHQQPVFARYPALLNGVCDRLFETGLCLPSGSSLLDADLDRVVATIQDAVAVAAGAI
jgi:dTDP-4-amino-4,6-dideoxygalactose transaminase